MKRFILFLIWIIAFAVYPATADGIKSSGGKSKKKSEKKIKHTPESKTILDESKWSHRTERRANWNNTAKFKKKQRKKVKHKSRDFEFKYDSFGRSEGLYKDGEHERKSTFSRSKRKSDGFGETHATGYASKNHLKKH